MPTYEYRCTACQHDFEKFQRMSEAPRAECPECGAEAQRRLSGGAGLLFKGSGFYITDYRSESYKKAAGSDAGGETKGNADKPSSGKGPGEKSADKPPPKNAPTESG
jgi:putative FmdB family regulatory protein